MEYYAIARGKTSRELVPITRDVQELVDGDRDWYQSIFLYNEEHYKRFQATHSLAGINDVTTDRLIWDFDDKANVEKAREDAKELCQRLIGHGVPPEAIHAAFSGMKGFSIELHTDSRFTPEQFKNINVSLAEGLKTNDSCIHDAQRIMRVIGTKHDISGLFKLPLTLDQLMEVSADEIKMLATDMDNCSDFDWPQASLPESIVKMGEKQGSPLPVVVGDVVDLDFTRKPRGFSNCKFAVMNGFFPGGKRNHMLMVLCATCRAQGFPKEVAYGICKSAARLQAQRTDTDPFPKEEIWNNIVDVVYGSSWKGAQYTCKTDADLREICEGLGKNKCKHDKVEDSLVHVEDMSVDFEAYSVNIEANTIKTGIRIIDDEVQLTVGMPVGILGSPSSGKTSWALDILENTSSAGINAVFFSMDMWSPLVFLKQIQRVSGLSGREVHHIFKHDRRKASELKAQVKERYKNVRFSHKCGHTVQDMRDIISEHQDATGDKVKLVVIDYLECVASIYSDATASSAKVAAELKDFSLEMGICAATLVQPPKSAGDASCALTSMRQVKGSSMLEQSFRVLFGIHREGFGPNGLGEDRYITINTLKNTMGGLSSHDFAWEGRRGLITELDSEGVGALAQLRADKRAAAAARSSGEWI